jgi:hypothetical protein
LIVLPLLFLAGIFVGTGLATPGSGFSGTILSVGRFGEIDVKTHTDGHKVEIRTKGSSDVYVVDNKFAPGGHTGWHTHPGPSLITVVAGTVTAYSGDDPTCTPHVYTAGMGFVDPGGGHVHILRNEGNVEARTIATQLIPAGAERRIDAPDPGNCPF